MLIHRIIIKLPKKYFKVLRFFYRIFFLYPIVLLLKLIYEKKLDKKVDGVLFKFADGSSLKYALPWEFIDFNPLKDGTSNSKSERIYSNWIIKNWNLGIKNLNPLLNLWSNEGNTILISADFDNFNTEDHLTKFANENKGKVLLSKSFSRGYHLYFLVKLEISAREFTHQRGLDFLNRTLPTNLYNECDKQKRALSYTYLNPRKINELSHFIEHAEHWKEF